MKNHYYKNYFKIALISIAIAITSIFKYYCSSEIYYKHSINSALDYYGFVSHNQKHAIQNLFKHSSIIPVDQILTQAFPVRKTKEELVHDIISIAQGTQERFTIRTGKQERWEIKELAWMNQNKDEILVDLKELGFVDQVKPEKESTDAVCILGSTASSMADRIEYVNSLVESGLQTKAVILLAGERYVNEDIDGTKDQLCQIANSFNLQDWTKLTETHLMSKLYSKSGLHNKNIALHIIDTPRGDLPRPTTQTSILNLIRWLKSHDEIQNIIFISNQPYVKYQKTIIDIIFKEQHVNIKYEVVGSKAKNTNNLKPLLEGLGSYIWAATPLALSDMGLQITDEAIKESLKQLYSKNPLIYNTMPQIFNK